MRNVIKGILIILAIISFIISSIKPTTGRYDSTYDSTGVVVKMLDKNKVECGYYLQRKNNSPFITYYLYDGVTIYSSSMVCDEFNKINKDDIENIIVLDVGDTLLHARVNKISDRLNWFDFVDNETKVLREAGLIK